ncbi:DEAD/DEAH box helicase [Lactiplantibacillus xiangfangensis]|uniref:Atp-dependent dna helicase translocase n=1 Tax=Lactiplantibacillus xiangfangensis TaxID=942150 RepID=A0A0R2MAN8_9LACO|nr:DNA/RNA helicase [Lactiplantibacillus xiangfangensis]KRO09120.1 atp-dependent dna helicase translocase [Lactiplantibacillus xiangfangensis]
MEKSALYGRQLCLTPDEARDLPAEAQKMVGIQRNGQTLRCNRCGSNLTATMAQLPNQQYYCYQCLNLGRVSTLTSLYHIPEPNEFLNYPTCSWQGKLTSQQAECAERVRTNFEQRGRHLLWAVTGAGKTEMLFPGLAWALSQGLRCALASPRVDVCLELAPRLQAAFQDAEIALLHGRSDEPYRYCQLTICTTHQLLRFRSAFDVLIIDEVDAFPFATNPRLHYAVNQAVKPNGALLYMTATPSRELLRQVRRRQLSISYLPLRFHQHLLPTIKVSLQPHWWRTITRGQLPPCLRRKLTAYAKSHQRFLLFVPRVAQLAQVKAAIERAVPTLNGLTVHSTDPERLEKVQRMRDHQVQFLVTTTILERGVTLPGIDVIVLGADDSIFSTAALVQIAGRVGRSRDRPDGLVWFLCASYARTIKNARRQIKLVNQKGRRLQRAMPIVSSEHSS